MSMCENSPASQSSPAGEFITAQAAGKLAGVHRRRLLQWADAGLVTTRRLPFAPPKFLKSDVEALVANSITPARTA